MPDEPRHDNSPEPQGAWQRLFWLVGALLLAPLAHVFSEGDGNRRPFRRTARPPERNGDAPPRSGDVEVRYRDGRIEHPSVRRERTDISFRGILFVLLGVMGFAALIQWAVLEFFYRYNSYQSTAKRSPFPLATTPANFLPAEPRLEQLNRLDDVEASNVFLREQAKLKVLDSFGPTDDQGFVHIPIDQAMKHLAGKLPVRKEAPAGETRDRGLVDWGESNSGRMFRRQPLWVER